MGSQRLMSLCLATLALCLVAGCGGGISASSLPVRRVASRDAAIRGLRFHHLPVVRLVSAGALQKLEQKHQQRLIATLPPAKRAQLARSDKDAQAGAEAAYLIGLLDPGEHPTASPSGPAALEGLYDETTHQIFLVKDSVKSKTKAESVLSHELDHALDEQHFGLGTLIGDAASDAPVAELAVREGVATLTELIYGRRYLHRPSAANEIAHFRRPPGPNTKLAREEASGLAFVYGAGTRFVYSLYNRAHGWALVNRALEHPPTTAAEILHPELYLSGVRARTPAGTAGPYLGKPWHRAGVGDVGEVDFAGLLGHAATPTQLAAAAPGWTGGRFELWEKGQGLYGCPPPCRAAATLLITAQWRTPAQRAKVTSQLLGYVKRDLKVRSGAGQVWAIQGGGGVAYAGSRNTLTLVYAPDPALAQRIARGALTQATRR